VFAIIVCAAARPRGLSEPRRLRLHEGHEEELPGYCVRDRRVCRSAAFVVCVNNGDFVCTEVAKKNYPRNSSFVIVRVKRGAEFVVRVNREDFVFTKVTKKSSQVRSSW
jgi:hypothetical protein